jgi:putative nucleotidyltransferase with HDIG domain
MFGRLFGKGKSTKNKTSAEPLTSSIRESVFKVVGVNSIPPMPAAAQKAFQLATDPNASARDFIGVIQADEGLSARVLKIANSVYFDRGKASKTIEESVTVIGINELRCLLNATTLAEIFPCNNPARTQLWANDIATGLISRLLAQRFLGRSTDLAFLGGLMHDIGKLLLLQRATADYRTVMEQAKRGTNFISAEEDAFVCNHTEVGQLIAEKWHFSPELIAIIRYHHQTWPKNSKSISLPLVVKAADTIAHALGLGHPSSFGGLQNRASAELEEVWKFFAIPNSEQRQLLDNCKRVFELEFDLYNGKGAE